MNPTDSALDRLRGAIRSADPAASLRRVLGELGADGLDPAGQAALIDRLREEEPACSDAALEDLLMKLGDEVIGWS